MAVLQFGTWYRPGASPRRAYGPAGGARCLRVRLRHGRIARRRSVQWRIEHRRSCMFRSKHPGFRTARAWRICWGLHRRRRRAKLLWRSSCPTPPPSIG